MANKRTDIWERSISSYEPSKEEKHYFEHLAKKRPKYDEIDSNRGLDIDSKIAVLKASPSIVALVSSSGNKKLSQGSGFIIEQAADEEENTFIVLTSASLIRKPHAGVNYLDSDSDSDSDSEFADNTLADNLKVVVIASDDTSYKGEICGFDFHYNLLAIKFRANASLPVAKLRHFDDCLSLNSTEEKPFLLRPHSVRLAPGDNLIAVGRYFAKPFDIMAAQGCFSIDGCDHECKELFTVLCKITQCGDGGALVNISGEVIGITFNVDGLWTPFLPIKIARLWWEHYKMCRESRHPYLGFEATNLFAAEIDLLERISRQFPSIAKGVLVELVVPGSSAHSAGLQKNDIIVKCDGNPAESFLELFELMWNKVGRTVELLVVRAKCSTFLTINIMVVETAPDKFYRWRQCP